MTKIKRADIASLMMLLWFVISFFFPERWASFTTIFACGLPMILFKHSVRGKTFGTRDCNTVIYKKGEYISFFVFTVSGTALVSAVTHLIFKAFGTVTVASAPRSDFLYLLVFSCMLPAFFEEWLLRGGVLGALAKYGSAGVIITAVFFALMHRNAAALPYALFAGVFITALVYVTECIYLGMLLHFLNNLTSLLLSLVQNETGEYIALFAVAVTFMVSAKVMRETKLCKDTVKLIYSVEREKIKELCTPFFWVFVALVALALFCAKMFAFFLPQQ